MNDRSLQQIKTFQAKILLWYRENKRDLPWRKTRDPYRILISEVMLQQTQVNRVIPKYEAWLEKFPTVKDLAFAKTSEVLSLWSGLGYNRRALNLKKTAEIITKKYDGKFPNGEKELLALPGIGQYTAMALLCFAFDEQVTVIDTNIRKVILTQFLYRHSGEQMRLSKLPERGQNPDSGQVVIPLRGDRMTEREINKIAEQILPRGKAYAWNQALMDFSSAMLKKEKIAIPKQSKFIGSHRYYRGKILKLLLEKKKIPVKGIGELIKKDYTEGDAKWLNGLITELKDEGFIELKKDMLTLAS